MLLKLLHHWVLVSFLPIIGDQYLYIELITPHTFPELAEIKLFASEGFFSLKYCFVFILTLLF